MVGVFNAPPQHFATTDGLVLSDDDVAQCDKYLTDHHLRATKAQDITPGALQFDVWLDDRKVQQQDVTDALTRAVPTVRSQTVQLAEFVRDRWDTQVRKATDAWANPPTDPNAPIPDQTEGQLYRQGHKDGLAGAGQICPDHADAAGQTAYNQGYADGVKDRPRAKLTDRLLDDMKRQDADSLKQDLDDLSSQDMHLLLDVVADIQSAGQLDELANHLVDRKRTGIAVQTLAKDFGGDWDKKVAALGEDDRKAILDRVPAGTYTAPQGSDNDDDDDGGPLTLGVMFVPKQLHTTVKGPAAPASDPKTIQVLGQYEIAAHKAGKKIKFSWFAVAQASFFYDPDTKKLTSQPMLGAQGTVDAFIVKLVHMQAYLQMLEGATFEVGKKLGKLEAFPPLATTQVAAGVQAVFNIYGKHLQLVLQAQVSATEQSGSVTVDKATGAGLQWAF